MVGPRSSRRDPRTRAAAVRRRRCRFHDCAWSKTCGECEAILNAGPRRRAALEFTGVWVALLTMCALTFIGVYTVGTWIA